MVLQYLYDEYDDITMIITMMLTMMTTTIDAADESILMV